MSKKGIYCINDLYTHAINRNGLCLSTVYKGCDDKYSWQCDKNHKWNATWYEINKRNSWCRRCMGKTKLTNEDIDEQLKDRNLFRLDDYINDRTKIRWKCKAKGHIWPTSPTSIKHGGTGCPYCHGNAKLTNKYIDQILISENRNIKRLDDYINSKTKMNWKCLIDNCEYIWETSVDNLIRGSSGCAKCYGNVKLTNEDIDKKLIGRFIKRLSNFADFNANDPTSWQCLIDDCEYVWSTSSNLLINHETGCPKCAGLVKLTNEDIDKALFETNRNIKRLDDYVNIITPIRWQCLINECEYIWSTTPGSVINGENGCSNCSSFKSEKICRAIFTELFDKKFFKIRPNWLINDIGNKLELDGYNEELLIAFEYNGIQHREVCDYFHDSIENVEKRKRHDKIKIKLCKENNVNLIVIDAPDSNTTKKKILNIIFIELNKQENENLIKYLTDSSRKQLNEYIDNTIINSNDIKTEQ